MSDEIDETVEINLDFLDGVENGKEFNAADLRMLAILGIAIPAILLILGWVL